MPDYRKKLTLETIGGQRMMILQCNKSEMKSVVRCHASNGTVSWAKETVASRHADGKPKHLHILLPDEGVYEVFGQPHLSGSYAIYRGSNGTLYYSAISVPERAQVLQAVASGSTYRAALTTLGKSLF